MMSYNTFNTTETMNLQQLQTEIQKTQAQLQKLQEQLENSKVTIETAPVGTVLPDGCVVVERYPNSILIAAPSNTEVKCKWTPDFPDVFTKLTEAGFIPAQWHVPSPKELQLAYKNCKEQFSSPFYWSSTESSSTDAYDVHFTNGFTFGLSKAFSSCVRAFRRVVF